MLSGERRNIVTLEYSRVTYTKIMNSKSPRKFKESANRVFTTALRITELVQEENISFLFIYFLQLFE